MDSFDTLHDSAAWQVVRQHYGPAYRPKAITACRGGFSGARVWRVESPAGSYCLRRWSREHPSPRRLEFIHTVLVHAAGQGCGVLSLPCPNLQGRTFCEHEGHLWELSPWLPGEAKTGETIADEELRAAMVALGEFHGAAASHSSARSSGEPCPAVGLRLQAMSRFDQWAERLYNQWAVKPALASESLRDILDCYLQRRERLRAELAATSVERFAIAPCLRDIWSDHVLLEAGVVRGIIDYGALALDSPATDVARLLGSYAGNGERRWQLGIEAYESVREYNPAQRRLAAVLDLSGALLAGMNWIDWLYRQERQFAEPQAVQSRLAAIRARLQGLPAQSAAHWLATS